MVKLGSLFEANRSVLDKLMITSTIGDQFRALTQILAPQLDILKTAAERARMIDMATLRATANAVATSSAVVMAEQVIEAQRIVDAIGQTEDPAKSADLLVAFMTLMSAMFSTFGENTAKELRTIGAFALLGILLNFQTIYKEFTPQDLTPAELKTHEEMVAHVETIEEKLNNILATDEASKKTYIGDYPRGELKRDAAIRSEPQGKAKVLMRGDGGTAIAVKESRGKWRLVIYRDPLTDQLSEGWVYALAVELLDAPSLGK